MDLKPWAAYTLGYNSFMVRVWQIVFWEHAESYWEADDGVLLTVDEIRQAVVHLVREAHAGVLAKLSEVLEDLVALNEAWKRSYDAADEEGHVSDGGTTIPGADSWQNLRVLADDALDEDSSLVDWYRLGASLGRYQLELENRDVGDKLPDLRPIFDRATVLVAKGIREIPELTELARFFSSSKKVGPAKILETFCKARHSPCLKSAAGRISLILPRIRSLNERIQEGLRRLQQDASKTRTRSSRSEVEISTRKTSERTTNRAQFLPSPLQKHILDVLNGRALKKQALATEVCAGEGTRLYRPGGIKELRAFGMVAHKSGLGYYRPDSPPPNAIDLSVN
jgi:hypothetical protein